jgi:hypothetical protein
MQTKWSRRVNGDGDTHTSSVDVVVEFVRSMVHTHTHTHTAAAAAAATTTTTTCTT